MAHMKVKVTSEKADTSLLPTFLNEYPIVLKASSAFGHLAEVSRFLRVRRKAGHADFDMFAFIMAFFCVTDRAWKFKQFYYETKPYKTVLAQLTGRARWPSSSSVSRYLSVVTTGAARKFGRWMARVCASDSSLLRRKEAASKDTHGSEWHFFDFDYQVETTGVRRLPVGETYPPAMRLTPGAPSTTSVDHRRRRYECGYLQHRGTSLWLGATVNPAGSQRMAVGLQEASRRVVDVCAAAEIPRDRAVLRVDGAGGNGPCVQACHEAGVRLLTRLSCYELFDHPELARRVATAAWTPCAVAIAGRGGRRRSSARCGFGRIRRCCHRSCCRRRSANRRFPCGLS